MLCVLSHFRSPLGDLPDPGIGPISVASPASQAGSLPTEPPGKPQGIEWGIFYFYFLLLLSAIIFSFLGY